MSPTRARDRRCLHVPSVKKVNVQSRTGIPCCLTPLQAYDTLSDAGLRSQYNAKLEQALVDNEDKYTGERDAG